MSPISSTTDVLLVVVHRPNVPGAGGEELEWIAQGKEEEEFFEENGRGSGREKHLLGVPHQC